MKRLAASAAVAAALAFGAIAATAAPASAATTSPIPIADFNSNINLCANPGPCQHTIKLYDRHGDLAMLCTTTACYRAIAMRFPGQHGWYVYLVGGGRAGPMPKRP